LGVDGDGFLQRADGKHRVEVGVPPT
jgi:hypothetical protein